MKKFRWNWGWSILLVFIIFMSIFTYVLIRSFDIYRNTDMSVEDYYTQELQYGKVLARKQNADTMRIPVQIINDKRGVSVVFPPYVPPSRVRGTLVLYRPNKKIFDHSIPLKLDSARRVLVPSDSLLYGRWDVHLQWQLDSVSYYVEKRIWRKQ